MKTEMKNYETYLFFWMKNNEFIDYLVLDEVLGIPCSLMSKAQGSNDQHRR